MMTIHSTEYASGKPAITIVGAGNVGSQLALVFHAAGYPIAQICSHPVKATRLAKKVDATAITDISEISNNADIYILCIPDQAIKDLQSQWILHDKLVCHTSGSTEMEALKDFSEHYGVFYPLQTFTRTKHVNFRAIPLCIEANSAKNMGILTELAKSISGDVRSVDTGTRMTLHLAAVIAGNFSNYMYVIAEDILQKKGLSFEILHPLIKETSHKAALLSPYTAQTGPARRKDYDTIKKHLEILNSDPLTRDIYDIITKSIIRHFQ